MLTAKSAVEGPWTKVESVAELLLGTGSVVEELTVAVFDTTAPSGTEGDRCTTTSKDAEAPLAKVAMVSLMLLLVLL